MPSQDPIGDLLEEARSLAFSGNSEAALNNARKAAQLAPRDARVWAFQGFLLASAGQLDEAIDSLQRSLSLDDSDLDVALALARIHGRKGQTDEALSLADYILLTEREQPTLRKEAQLLRDSLLGVETLR